MGTKFHGARYAGTTGLWNEQPIAPIMFRGRAHIPRQFSVGCPAFSGVRIFENQGSCPWGREWRSIEIEYAKQLIVG
jgi:hypothetical protein